MKKNSTKALCALAVLAATCTVTSASAGVITDTYDTNATLTFGGAALTFEHNILVDGYQLGDVITSATVAIHLMDQTVTGVNQETYSYDIGAAHQIFTCANGNCVPNPGATDIVPLNAASLAELEQTGKIEITVTSTSGEFLFADSTLTAQVGSGVGTEAVAAAPEPTTLALVGLGLLGFAASRRK